MRLVQSVLIDKSYGLEKSIKLLIKLGFKLKKYDISKNYYRFRQRAPADRDYYTEDLGNGIKLVYYYIP